MIRINNPADAAWIGGHAGVVYNPASDHCVARLGADGRLLGGVIFNAYLVSSMQGHFAASSEMWLSNDMLFVCFHYPFVQLGVSKLFGFTPECNTHALQFNARLGFKREAVLQDALPTGAMIVQGLYRDDCRWLKLRPRNLKVG